MSDGTKIEWTDATWNPIVGCSVVSPGCTNCYAMRLAGGRLRHHPSRAGLTAPSKAGPVWNGQVRLIESAIEQPLRWARPRRVFVCAHGDLFHENVPEQWIDRVFAVMALSPQHTFQVLTKRPERMRAYVRVLSDDHDIAFHSPWPVGNVWLGVSVEDQTRAEERIPILLDTPAAVHFISAEPLLGPVDIRRWLHDGACREATVCDDPHLDWAICGGESGPGARPMHRDWARSLRDQCAAAGTPFFFKQHGNWVWAPAWMTFDQAATWAGDRDYVHHSDGSTSARVGKKIAGRHLDGERHDGMPGEPATARHRPKSEDNAPSNKGSAE